MVRRIGKATETTDANGNTVAVGGGPETHMPDGSTASGGGGWVDATAFPFNPGPFPAFPTIEFDPIKAAPYKYVDPLKYATQVGRSNLAQMDANFSQAGRFATQALDNELAGLRAFAPGAAALSREQTGFDNTFNQQQRTSQVNQILPGARGRYDAIGGTLQAQRGRAETYASGRLTDDLLDRSFELGIRGGAADASTYSGLGPRSLAASKISDLQSAEARFGVAQYGENLLGTNINADEQLLREEQNLFLAPTAYSNTGQQIRPTPEVGAGRLTYQGAGMLNEASLISPGTALQSATQQQQFKTSLVQRTNEFNATGKFNAAQFNAQGQFQSAAMGFEANAQYLSSVQAANQGVLNNRYAAGLAEMGIDAFGGGVSTAQQAGTISSIAGALGAGVAAFGGAADLVGGSNTSSSPVGGTDVDTSPTGGTVSTLENRKDVGELNVPQSLQYVSSGSAEGSSPGAYKFQSGTAVPQGYVSMGKNSDGSYSAIRPSDYQNDLDRYSRLSGNPNATNAETVLAAAQADRSISSAAALSYVPIDGFQPIATLGSGKPVYSLPSASRDGNMGQGTERIAAAGLALNQLGVSDPTIYSELIASGNTLQDPGTYQSVDQAYARDGEVGATDALIQTLQIPHDKLDTAAGKRVAFGLMRIAELWPSLSPSQRSSALSSVAPALIEMKTGKNPSQLKIPHSESSAGGTLTVGQAMDITAKGRNGFALARNWGQLSAIGKLVGSTDPEQVAALSDATGFLGFGPQGASVSLPPEYLAKVGATPAPALGVGAAVFQKPSHVPRNYTVVTNTPEGGVVAIPANLKHTSVVDGNAPNPLSYKNAEIVSRNQHPAQKMWGKSPTRKIVRGAAGGSAIVSGMELAMKNSPALAGSMAAYSLFNRTMGHNGDESQ